MYGHSLFSDPVKVMKLQSCDFALFASAWWPRAPREELRILAYLSFWLFVWDDEIDEATGTLSDDFEASERYRQNTVAYITETLGLPDDLSLYPPKGAATPLNEIIGSFEVIGKALRQVYNIGPSSVNTISPMSSNHEPCRTTEKIPTRDGIFHSKISARTEIET